MMNVEIVTGSRLHFGLICGTLQTGWRFGGVGVMLRQPSWRITMHKSWTSVDQISASSETTDRVAEFLQKIRMTLPLPAVDVFVKSEVPFHTGLGGGTQLGLAIAAAAKLLSQQRDVHNPFELAELAQRAERSAIGTVGFRDGGFLVDYGLPDTPSDKRNVHRIVVPDAWRFVLVRPMSAQGLCGDQERSFFNQRAIMSESLVESLARQIDDCLVPSIQNEKFETFSVSLEDYGDAVGRFYAAEQGDIFAHPVIRKLVAMLRAAGIHGAAQSSWGPGISIPASSLEHAQVIVDRIPPELDGTQLRVNIAEPLNTGASFSIGGPEVHEGIVFV
jgi:beta-ribofuranosylaminobenzene 5'-phosphate synthase